MNDLSGIMFLIFFIVWFVSVESLEWTSPMSKAVDTFARYKYGTTVRDCMHMPQPPLHKPRPPTQAPGREVSVAVGEHERPREMIAEARKDLRYLYNDVHTAILNL